MKVRRLLAAFLLGVGLCFVPILGYGEDKLDERTQMEEALKTLKDRGLDVVTMTQIYLLESKLNYIMWNPHDFLCIYLEWDYMGLFHLKHEFPENVVGKTEGKLVIQVYDNRGVFFDISKVDLLDQFKKELKRIYHFMPQAFPKMDRDVVALFYDHKRNPLGYFYQGEYHLWETSRAKGTTKEEVTPSAPFLFENVTVWEISRLRSGAVLGTRLKGEVINQSGVTYNSHVWFRVTLYDRAGEVLGWREFTIFDLKDGQRKPFEVPFYGVNSGDVWDWKIEFDRGS